jgi:crotonobetainyl-CoA:carnitine CoA-transferase CaiB-like acyl-CoA transferase
MTLTNENMQPVLDGILVVEVGQILSAPYAAAILGDLGAEVVKVERPSGDDGRSMGPAFKNGDSMNFHIFNRGKKSVKLDLRGEEGKLHFDSLTARCDIFIHNLRPGVQRDLGMSGEELCKRYPRLVYCEISAFGHAGPMSQKPGYEPLAQAYGGLMTINGGPDDPPLRMGASVCDQGAGMWAVIGSLSLLRQRDITGVGGIVQTSLFETALGWAVQRTDAYRNQGVLLEKHATGHPNLVPYQSFNASDGAFLICAGNDRLFARLASVLGHVEWSTDSRFSTNRERLVHREELLGKIQPILLEKTRDQWITQLEAVGVPCSPIHTIPEVVALPQAEALGIFSNVPGEDYTLTGLPLTINGKRPQVRCGPPRLGEHNFELFGDTK